MLAVPVPGTIDHDPPVVTSVNAGVLDPTHTDAAPPVIAATVGRALTVSEDVAVLLQVPLLTVYTTVTVPEVIPVTTPPAVMLAVPVPFVIDQVPPVVALVNAGLVEPAQTVVAPPVIAETVGRAFIVSEEVAEFEQVPLVTV